MEETAEQPIIADTSGLIALSTITDQNHEPATNAAGLLRKAQQSIILPSDVLVETVNTLGKKSGHETALKAADALLQPGKSVLVETTAHIRTALEKFKEQRRPSALPTALSWPLLITTTQRTFSVLTNSLRMQDIEDLNHR